MPATTPLLFAQHLGHQPIHPDPAGDCLTMLTIGGDDGIPWRQSLHNPDRYRFLPVVKVQKSEDLLRLVQLHAFCFEMADADHLPKQMLGVHAV